MSISSDGLPVSQHHDVNLGAHMSACAAKPESAQDGSSVCRKKGAGASTQSTRELASFPEKTLPPCAMGNYDCANCKRPLIAQSPKGPLLPCDGTIHFCRFATPSTTTPACPRYDLHNYACTHGGGSCAGYRKRRRLSHAF